MADNAKQRSPCIIDFVADSNRRYPGEDVTLYGRVTVREPVAGFRLRFTLPEGLEPGVTRAPDQVVPQVAIDEGARHLVWTVDGGLEAGTRYEVQIEARVVPLGRDDHLRARAVVTAQAGDGASDDAPVRGDALSDEETVEIMVSTKGRVLKYLPGLYHQDELMGRFLMLFESFWKPIEGQIDHLPFYFDPRFTPRELLPWLASWLDLALDERWPEERRRLLIRSAAMLYRKRGTKQGLQRYLEIFTGDQVEIVEHRANNFRLGPEGRLGPGIALGRENVPHTFTVHVRLPPLSAEGEKETQEELERRRIIKAIIQAEKPAHTDYTLRFETA
jgi:phage tail-like protein